MSKYVSTSELKWQTGKPPSAGWYWVWFKSGEFSTILYFYDNGRETWIYKKEYRWAGPLVQPEAPKDDE